MLYISTDEIKEIFGELTGYFLPTIDCAFYHEAVVWICDNETTVGEDERLSLLLMTGLKKMWNCDTIYKNTVHGECIERYYVSKHGRITMADQKIIELPDDLYDYSDDSLFNINSWGADLSFRELILMYKEDELVKPELQRKYVWSKEEASKFIDSLLLGLPVPSIFLAKVGDQKLIIDGYQRLMTVYDYVNGIFSGDGKIFKLTNSTAINERWRGKAFAELPSDEQRRIKSTTIHAIIFEQKHPANDSGMYKIFERINTSGRNLKPQEIRNCVYHGVFNSALMELNDYQTWRNLWGSPDSDSRMTDIEFILRFFTLKNVIENGTELRQLSLKKELNSFMAENSGADENTLCAFSDEFKRVVDLVWQALGADAFRNLTKATPKNPVQKFSSSIHPAIFDAVTIATALFLRDNANGSTEKFTIENYKTLLNNDEFRDCITVRTTNTDKLQRRIELARTFLFGA